MDGKPPSIFRHELYPHLGAAAAPVMIGVRREDAFAADDRLIIEALRCPHHVDDCCSWDAIIRAYDIPDAALDRPATIVRGADTSRLDLAPQCEGLLAISRGLSANSPDDHELLRRELVNLRRALCMYRSLHTEHQNRTAE
ncbi:MAG TPA: chromate resistance protein ChrB domain-containing protein [Pseudolabrys sp.]|jgi:hypothetical protein|nr:chromate resistance protein ChrB domain-containing protein [Pseudolabrys sp.]